MMCCGDESTRIKIIDFGLAKKLEKGKALKESRLECTAKVREHMVGQIRVSQWPKARIKSKAFKNHPNGARSKFAHV